MATGKLRMVELSVGNPAKFLLYVRQRDNLCALRVYHAAGARKLMEILVADENVEVASMLAEMLRMIGHSSVVAADGSQAVAAATRKNFDACVIDLDLPPLGGGALLDSLRVVAGPGLARAVAWTAAEEVWRGAPTTRLFDAFVTKPVSLEMIEAALLARNCPACGRPLDVVHRHPLCQWTRPF